MKKKYMHIYFTEVDQRYPLLVGKLLKELIGFQIKNLSSRHRILLLAVGQGSL